MIFRAKSPELAINNENILFRVVSSADKPLTFRKG